MKVLAETGNLPVVETQQQKAPDALGTDVFTAFGTVSTANGLVPYLDWATPTMGDTLGATLQDLLAKKVTPQQAGLPEDKGVRHGGGHNTPQIAPAECAAFRP